MDKTMEQRNNLRIMVIDDDPEILECFKSIFEGSGAHLFLTKSSISAIEELKQQPYHIAFIDLYMPVMNGMETMLRLKELCPSLITTMISGFRNPYMLEAALNSGAENYLFKPLNVKEILMSTIVPLKMN